MTTQPPALLTDITASGCGWLSSNNILIRGEQGFALMNIGSASHAGESLALVGAPHSADLLYQRHFSGTEFFQWVDGLLNASVRAGAAAREGLMIRNAK